MKFCHKILDSKLSYGENQKSISVGVGTVLRRDRHQDGQTLGQNYCK